jgi:hypothetical protein
MAAICLCSWEKYMQVYAEAVQLKMTSILHYQCYFLLFCVRLFKSLWYRTLRNRVINAEFRKLLGFLPISRARDQEYGVVNLILDFQQIMQTLDAAQIYIHDRIAGNNFSWWRSHY